MDLGRLFRTVVFAALGVAVLLIALIVFFVVRAVKKRRRKDLRMADEVESAGRAIYF